MVNYIICNYYVVYLFFKDLDEEMGYMQKCSIDEPNVTNFNKYLIILVKKNDDLVAYSHSKAKEKDICHFA